jgi:arylsulfatase A-like enzyme
VRTRAPSFAFAALTGVDKTSHAFGHESSDTLAALRIVDELVAELRHDAERDGRWESMHLYVVSDHGHSAVTRHDDLAGAVRARGYGVIAHPWVFGHRRDVAVMVSGNAMAHLYVDLADRERQWWPTLAGRWEPLVEMLLDRESVDLVLLPHDASRCEVRARDRGTALVERDGDRVCYRMLTGDPLGLGDDVDASDDESHERSLETDYPDALVQILSLCGSARAGDITLSAARDWDFRAYWEPIPHRSSHGALHREHMLVPLIANREVAEAPRRTTDLFATTVDVLGLDAPAVLDGRSFARGGRLASTG